MKKLLLSSIVLSLVFVPTAHAFSGFNPNFAKTLQYPAPQLHHIFREYQRHDVNFSSITIDDLKTHPERQARIIEEYKRRFRFELHRRYLRHGGH